MSFQDQINAEEQQKANAGRRFQFYKEPIEDRNETIKAGKPVYRDRDMCRVYKVGGNGDYVEWIIEELPPEKLSMISETYKSWKAGQEDPVNGTPLKMCPIYSPADIMNLQAHHVLSVEQHANVPDNLLANLGMGAMAMRDKARAWLASANDVGKVAQANAALQAEVDTLKSQLADALEGIEILKSQLPEKRKPGRPRKEEEEAA